ncbi:MAG: ATP-binding protein [Cyanobacteria bacterium J06581_3]
MFSRLLWFSLIAIPVPSPDLLPNSSPTQLKPSKKLDLLFRNSPLAMIEWDSNLVIVGWNAAAAELFSFFEDEAIGQRIDELLAQRQMADLSLDSWKDCPKAGVVREHVGISGKKLCRWFNTPFMQKGQRVSTLSTIVEITQQTALSNEELRSQLQSRTQVLKHTTARLQSAISDRAQTHTALHATESRFKSLTLNVPGVLYQFCLQADGTYSVPYVSPACKDLYELSDRTIQSDPEKLLALIHSDDRTALEQSIQKSAETLSAWNIEHPITTPSGQQKWVQIASQPQSLPTGDIMWSGMVTDITDRKQAETRLQKSQTQLRAQTKQLKATLKKLKHAQLKLVQSEKMSSLGQLVAGIAHELNNPATFIHGNLIHIKEYTQDLLKVVRLYQAHYPTPNAPIASLTNELELDYVASDLPKLLDSVRLGTERIRKIVLSLRNFSRLDETGLKRVDIHEGLENTLMLLNSRLDATISRPAISIVKAYESLPPVDCYADQLNQVFMNILTNAIDAIDQAGVCGEQSASESALESNSICQVSIQTFQRNDSIVIQITNSGPPVPPEVSRRMFDPFFTTKVVGQGTGMGLAISYQTIVDLHKGSLEYTRTSEGKPTFVIAIPVVQVTES